MFNIQLIHLSSSTTTGQSQHVMYYSDVDWNVLYISQWTVVD